MTPKEVYKFCESIDRTRIMRLMGWLWFANDKSDYKGPGIWLTSKGSALIVERKRQIDWRPWAHGEIDYAILRMAKNGVSEIEQLIWREFCAKLDELTWGCPSEYIRGMYYMALSMALTTLNKEIRESGARLYNSRDRSRIARFEKENIINKGGVLPPEE